MASRALEACGMAVTVSGDVPDGLRDGLSVIVEGEPRPHAVLSAAVEDFDVGLKAARQRRSELGRVLPRQASPGHAVKRIGPAMGLLVDGAVVELRFV